MKRINHLPGTIEGCATRHGTLVGPVMTDITGFEEITPYKGGWCGNDMAPDILPEGVPDKVREMARKFGDRLYGEGYKGVFCLDFLLDTDTNEVYLGELNPRISGASPPTNLITTTYGGCPLFLFHLLEYLDVDWELDLEAVQARWNDYDNWTPARPEADRGQGRADHPGAAVGHLEDGAGRQRELPAAGPQRHQPRRRERGLLSPGLRRRANTATTAPISAS